MKKLNINKDSKVLNRTLKVIRNSIIGTMILVTPLLSSCTSKKSEEHEVTQYVVNIDEIDTKDDSISLFNVGNFEFKGKSNIKDIKRANKKGVPCGLIINTMASNKSEMYNDVEYVKYIIERHKIDCPVYLNIDNLTNNHMLRVDEMLVLISTFASKLTENKVLVGICGSESNIYKLKENDETHILDAYDIFLSDNDKSLDVEPYISSMIKTSDNGDYITYENFEKICNEKKLNKSSNFLCDRVHEVKDGETLADIAFTYGLSVNDLLEYNGYNEKDNPKVLRIPSVVSSIGTDMSEFTKKSDSELALGLDISACESKVDWDILSERYDFLILKATWHTNVADKFEEFSAECSYRDIPYGVYCANYVSSLNVKGLNKTEEEMKKAQLDQIETILKAVSNKNVTLPIFLDFEDFDGNNSYAEKYTDEQCIAMLDIWYDILKKAGYTPGVYSNKRYLKKLQNAYNSKYGDGALENKFKLWISGDIVKNYGYDSKVDYNESQKIIDDLDENVFYIENVDVDFVQPWQYGINFGASNDEGHVDVNFAKLDNLIKNNSIEETDEYYDYELTKTKEPHQKSLNIYILTTEYGKYIIYSLVALSSAYLGYISKSIIDKEKSKKKSKRYIRR